jgi:NAD(P)H-dependent FMN reductase
MTGPTLRLVVLIGSVREGRFGPTVARWFAAQASTHGRFTVDLVDLVDFPLPLVMPEPGQQPEPATARVLDELRARIGAADAFAVVTPEYTHTLPAVLKNTIDWIFGEWAAKPVAFVSYGGMGGGLRAVEHLRTIFAELHAVSVRESLSFHNPWSSFTDGVPADHEESAVAAKTMLDRLQWWGEALHHARTERPYEH